MRALWALALGDFRDRVRRPAYAVILLGAVGLGALAVPAADSHWVILQIGDYRGRHTSAYVGTATALAGALWLSLAGFFVVRNGLSRDESSGVGRVLAATPLRTGSYLVGKLLSSVLVLASMAGVLAVTAAVLQLVRGESGAVRPVELLLPFVAIVLPVLAVTAAAALVSEALPVLRGGLGNVVWFFLWMAVVLGGQGAGGSLDVMGVRQAVATMRTDLVAQYGSVSGEFSLGFTYLERPLRTFEWGGFVPDGGFVLTRVVMVGGAVVVALLPVLWFGRFDPARGDEVREVVMPDAGWSTSAGRGRVGVERSGPVGVALRLVVGEARILVQGVAWWWWAGAAVISLGGLAATGAGATRVVLPMAWIWPVLLWSRLGTQRHEYGVQTLLGGYPAARLRLLAEWAAGVALTGAVGAAPLVRVVAAGDGQGVASWAAGALFIPSLALAVGSLSRTHRVFQALYLPLWWSVVNGLPFVDFMGASRLPGRAAALSPVLVATGAGLLMVVAFAAASGRRAPRTG